MFQPHRHSRAHVRHHFVRVALNRRRTYLDMLGAHGREHERFDVALGRFDKRQPYLGCGRPGCGICHPSKRWHRGADRLSAERSWRAEWADELALR